ncbi:MAG TPA: amidohydrolase family protein [Solirubrobacteraceae bacterium]
MAPAPIDSAYATLEAELEVLLPRRELVLDAHTHLGLDEDGQKLAVGELLAYLDLLSPQARACVFPLHDPERQPAYRMPNDRVLAWAREADGRLVPYCRLDPADDPIGEAERCLALGARGIKLHPRAQSFGFGNSTASAIFDVARDAAVPILIHAGRGMPPMDALADLALRYPEVTLVLAHAGIADQGMFATRLAEHPAILYDTSTFSAPDLLELFARVPAERIVFASDMPYGRPIGGLFHTMRIAAYAGLDMSEREAVAGATMAGVLEAGTLPTARPPRLPQARAVSGRLARISAYLSNAMGAITGSAPPLQPAKALPGVALARNVCRDPDPGPVGPALEWIDSLLAGVEEHATVPDQDPFLVLGLVMAAATIAATEPVAAP